MAMKIREMIFKRFKQYYFAALVAALFALASMIYYLPLSEPVFYQQQSLKALIQFVSGLTFLVGVISFLIWDLQQ